MDIENMRTEFEASFFDELEVDLSGNRHTDGEGLECYQFDGNDEDERSKLASIAFLFWQASRAAIVIELPPEDQDGRIYSSSIIDRIEGIGLRIGE